MIKGMIFAAGLGTRLKPLTDTMPKAMVEVGGIPMLRRVIDSMVSAGIAEIVVNVHHFANMITDYLERHRAEIPARIIISDESSLLLDTGGGLLHASPLLDDAEAVVLHNADILCDADLGLLAEMHLFTDADATLMVDPQRESSRRLLFDSDFRLHGRINLKSGALTPPGIDTEGLHRASFQGIHVVSPTIFPALRTYAGAIGREVFSITDFYCDTAASLDIRGYVAERPSTWLDVGRPESLATARGLYPC